MTASTRSIAGPARRGAPQRGRLPRWLKRGLRAWARWSHAMATPRRRQRGRWQIAAAAPGADELQAADENVDERRCGWFDSSQDLREGLSVSEHGSGDTVCAQLPVMAWVQLQLSGWRPDVEAALPSLR